MSEKSTFHKEKNLFGKEKNTSNIPTHTSNMTRIVTDWNTWVRKSNFMFWAETPTVTYPKALLSVFVAMGAE